MSGFRFGKGPRVASKGALQKRGGAAQKSPAPGGTEAFEDVQAALRHLLNLLERTVRYSQDTQIESNAGEGGFEQEVRRYAIRVGRADSWLDLGAAALDVSRLKLPVSLDSEPSETATRILHACIVASLPIAQALRMEGATLGIERLSKTCSDVDSMERAPEMLAMELERLAEGVAGLRKTTEVLRDSVAELVDAIGPLAQHEPASQQRLRLVRERLETAAEIRELEELRQVLVQETTCLVEEARARSKRANEASELVRLTETHVKILEYALADAKTMAQTDPMTGLGNRRALEASVAAHAGSTAATGVLAIDVDHFKKVNDSHGHAAGDAVLRYVAATLRAELRGDDQAFRVGGEEFSVLLGDTSEEGAARTAERLRERLSRHPVHHDGVDIEFTVSIGVSLWGAGVGFKQAAEAADRALYVAKQQGRNRVVQSSTARAEYAKLPPPQ